MENLQNKIDVLKRVCKHFTIALQNSTNYYLIIYNIIYTINCQRKKYDFCRFKTYDRWDGNGISLSHTYDNPYFCHLQNPGSILRFSGRKKKVPASQGAETPLDPSLVAAITSAVHQYRKDIINKE